MRGELIFDMNDLAVMQHREGGEIYAVNSKELHAATIENIDNIRLSHRTGQVFESSELNVRLVVEVENGKFDLSNIVHVVKYDELKSVLVSCN